MSFSRRGFLQTLAASLVGAAAFDPEKLLWVPAALPPPVLVEAASGQAAMLLMERDAELHELARAVACAMTQRLEHHPSIGLREVMYRHTGGVQLPTDLLEVDEQRGHFAVGRRLMAHVTAEPFTPQYVSRLADRLKDEIYWNHDGLAVDMFAPITRELRPGDAFSDDMAIGIGQDPQSGLSVRVLSFEHGTSSRHPHRRIGVEMAGGKWRPLRRPTVRVTLDKFVNAKEN